MGANRLWGQLGAKETESLRPLNKQLGIQMKFTYVLLILLMLSGCSMSKSSSVHSEPATLLQLVVQEILSEMSSEDKEKVKSQNQNDLYGYYHGWGTGIRNNYGLWRGNDELIKSACRGDENCHPETASMFIILGVWNSLNGLPVESGSFPKLREIETTYE